MGKSGLILLAIVSLGCESAHSPIPSQGEWKLVNENHLGFFHGLHFADQMNGWAVGDSGRILSTKDGGDSWNSQQSGTTVSLKCVQFVNPSRGWIGGGNNSIGSSTDGGASWTWQHSVGEPRRMFMGVSFVSANNGWIVDNFGGILHTEDGGLTWTPLTSGTTWAITSVQYLDAHVGWGACNGGILYTYDGGIHWTFQLRRPSSLFVDVYSVSPSRCWALTFQGSIYGYGPP